MRTVARVFKSSIAACFIFSIVTWSGAASAQPEAAPVPAPAEPSVPPPPSNPPAGASPEAVPAETGVPPVSSPAPTREATAVAGSIPPPPEPAVEAPPVTEIGIQRLPGSAYPEPQTRGLKYGSLWLTFHGLQWPYLPAKLGRDRFVVGLSGWGWADTSYVTFRPWGQSTSLLGQDQITYWKQQARMLLRVTPTYSFDNWFVQGQVELVGTMDQTIERSQVGGNDTDDLWLRVGQWNVWDFQVGRFEGWEVFHLGMGLDQNTFERGGAASPNDPSISFYGLTDNQFRPQGAAGNFALHYYPFQILRFEALTTVGSSGGPEVATRPVAILDLGWLKLKGGVEWQHIGDQLRTRHDETTSKGVGGAVQFVFEPHVEFGLNVAQGTVLATDTTGHEKLAASYTRTSYGGFLNVANGSDRHPVLLGVGALFTRDVDQQANPSNPGQTDEYWLWQSYVAAQYVLFNQLYIKLVGSYSRAHFLTAGTTISTFDDENYSLRLRFAFYF